VAEAMRQSRVGELREPTLNPGETYADLLADRSAWEDFEPDTYFGAKGFGFVRLNQLAIEHLVGAR
jgi:xylose isomerase